MAGGILALLGSAGPVAAQENPRAGGELIFVVPAEPPSHDAHREETFAVVHPAAPHYNTLLRVDPGDRTGTRIVGDLAASWTASRDGRTYTFSLRRGVRFRPIGQPRRFETEAPARASLRSRRTAADRPAAR